MITLNGMRTVQVAAPEGSQWTVRVAWQPRWRSLARRFNEWWEQHKQPGTPPLENLDIDGPGGCLASIVVMIGAMIIAGLFWWLVVPLLLMIVDVAIVVVVLVVTVAARVVFRRPWTVEATASDGRIVTAHVKGWRAALRRRDEIADQLRQGHQPWRPSR
jgi:Flp pilus assembly protein TadB